MAICAACKKPIPNNQGHDLCETCLSALMNIGLSFVISKDMKLCVICDELRCVDNLVESEGDLVCCEGCSTLKQPQTLRSDFVF